MASPEDRMSTTVVQSLWLSPDDRTRPDFLTDYERGPIAIQDTSQGSTYQAWTGAWNGGTGDFVLTPETTGSPSTIITVPNVTQFSFCFDQNGRPAISYTVNNQAYLYWYDTQVANFVTTALPVSVICPVLSLDDKRATQNARNDYIMWWTEEQGDGTYNLYRALQRDRFNPLVKKLMATGTPMYTYKAGMAKGIRVQIGMSNTLI